jgi:hypothetical protein
VRPLDLLPVHAEERVRRLVEREADRDEVAPIVPVGREAERRHGERLHCRRLRVDGDRVPRHDERARSAAQREPRVVDAVRDEVAVVVEPVPRPLVVACRDVPAARERPHGVAVRVLELECDRVAAAETDPDELRRVRAAADRREGVLVDGERPDRAALELLLLRVDEGDGGGGEQDEHRDRGEAAHAVDATAAAAVPSPASAAR